MDHRHQGFGRPDGGVPHFPEQGPGEAPCSGAGAGRVQFAHHFDQRADTGLTRQGMLDRNPASRQFHLKPIRPCHRGDRAAELDAFPHRRRFEIHGPVEGTRKCR
jgi:hypothetical protein